MSWLALRARLRSGPDGAAIPHTATNPWAKTLSQNGYGLVVFVVLVVVVVVMVVVAVGDPLVSAAIGLH